MSRAGVRIEAARPADLDALCVLEAQAFTTDRMPRRSFRRFLSAPTAFFRVARQADEVAGYALILFSSRSTLARLYSIAVAPEAAGCGIGSALLSAGERDARRRGADRIRLQVRERNKRAVSLYERAGYQRIDLWRDYYEDGASALVMEKSLTSSR